MITRLSGAGPRFGALLALALSTPVTPMLAPDASAAPTVENTRTTSEFAVVSTHVWQQAPGTTAAPVDATGTWVDGLHGPVLDGVLLSTPMLVALLLGIAALALFMAGRASAASTVPVDHPASGEPR